MLRHYLVRVLLYCTLCAALYAGVGAALVFNFQDGLPSFAELENVDPARTTNIYSADGKILRKFWVQRRDPITYDQLPEAAIDALDMSQWTFYVLPTDRIDQRLGNQKTVGLGRIKSAGAVEVAYGEIYSTIKSELRQ